MLDSETIVNDAIRDSVVILCHQFKRMTGLGIVDIVPKHGRMVALDEFAKLGIGILSVGLALRLDRLGESAGVRMGPSTKVSIISAGVIKTHAQPGCV